MGTKAKHTPERGEPGTRLQVRGATIMDAKKLNKILKAHAQWLAGTSGGARADLRGADLRGADLRWANLRWANLREADLREADLSWANLYGVDLNGANLRGANLREADLSGANLSGADLRGRSVCPPSGAFTAFKKVRRGVVLELLIPADAARVSVLCGRKCRASKAIVVRALNSTETSFASQHDVTFVYTVGATVEAPLNDDPRIECASGIHFFMEQAEAEAY